MKKLMMNRIWGTFLHQGPKQTLFTLAISNNMDTPPPKKKKNTGLTFSKPSFVSVHVLRFLGCTYLCFSGLKKPWVKLTWHRCLNASWWTGRWCASPVREIRFRCLSFGAWRKEQHYHCGWCLWISISPMEVGSEYSAFYDWGLYIPGGCLADYWTINSIRVVFYNSAASPES